MKHLEVRKFERLWRKRLQSSSNEIGLGESEGQHLDTIVRVVAVSNDFEEFFRNQNRASRLSGPIR